MAVHGVVCGGHLIKFTGHSNTHAGHPAGSGASGGGANKTPALFVHSHSFCGQAVAMLQGGHTGMKVAS